MSSAGAIHGHNGDANEHLEGDDSDATALPRSSPGLTVSFKDIGIQVHGLGEDYGSTCLSVLGDLIFPSGKSAKTTRVRELIKDIEWPETNQLLPTAYLAWRFWPSASGRNGIIMCSESMKSVN